MDKGGDKLARGSIPELGAVIFVRRQNPSAVRTKRRAVTWESWAKEVISLLESTSQSLAVLSRLPSGFEHRPD